MATTAVNISDVKNAEQLIRLLKDYKLKKREIKARLGKFKKLPKKDYLDEFLFCLLTPASNAKKCWQAVELIRKEKKIKKNKIKNILKKHTRFHNYKTSYLLENIKKWGNIKNLLKNEENGDRKILRNYLAENIKGYGLKEASHFLRNIGKSDNQIAILDRHIIRNLKSLGVIKDDKVKGTGNYLDIEEKFLNFSKKINVPLDELDLLFWSRETGKVFK